MKPVDSTTLRKVKSDPEDTADAIGMDAIDHFAQFIRGTKALPRDLTLAATEDAQAGQKLFETVGCNICHIERMKPRLMHDLASPTMQNAIHAGGARHVTRRFEKLTAAEKQQLITFLNSL